VPRLERGPLLAHGRGALVADDGRRTVPVGDRDTYPGRDGVVAAPSWRRHVGLARRPRWPQHPPAQPRVDLRKRSRHRLKGEPPCARSSPLRGTTRAPLSPASSPCSRSPVASPAFVTPASGGPLSLARWASRSPYWSASATPRTAPRPRLAPVAAPPGWLHSSSSCVF